VVDAIAEFSPRRQEKTPTAASARSDPPQRAARAQDPADPFAEEFDEEEIVLDNFAAWDEIFHRGTPRVENQRDRGLATLVQAAVEAYPAPEDRPTQSDFDRDELELEDVEIAAIDPAADAALPDESPTNRPRLRLAVVSESAAPEPFPTGPLSAPTPPMGRVASDSPADFEIPILIIEDEATAAEHAGPPVRRETYQHLFSRLRSG